VKFVPAAALLLAVSLAQSACQSDPAGSHSGAPPPVIGIGVPDAQPARADAALPPADRSPSRADARPAPPDTQPATADARPATADARPATTDARPATADAHHPASDTGAPPPATADAGASGVPPASTIVPLYTPPGHPSWAAIEAAQRGHPRVPVIAIVNPANGPGAVQQSAYTTGIAGLVGAGIRVIGYVATGYAARADTAVRADVDRWRSYYPAVTGIFFDEQSNKAGDEGYYRTLSQYAKSQGLGFTVGNPGTDTSESFIGALDAMLIYESKGLPAESRLAGWHAKYAPANFGMIPYGTAFDAPYVHMARTHVGYVYLSNDDLPNPWDSLPPYFAELLAALE
jgi:hypothetical protein